MKSILRFSALSLMIFMLLYISCKKEKSCENCRDSNKPPIANAGKDTIIVLPVDSMKLDGSLSSDPDGTIKSFLWTKILGPASFNIINIAAAKTIVKNLIVGVYQFELKVTDNGGLSAKDTVQVTVNPSDAPASTVIGCNVSMSVVGHLPTPGTVHYSFAAGTKLFFVRGVNGAVDIYDTLTHQWKTVNGMYATQYYLQSDEKWRVPKIAGKIVFSGPADQSDLSKGQMLNVYDTASDSWQITYLPQARSFSQVVTVGNKAFYIRNIEWDIKKIDVYDAAANSWSVTDFNEARQGMVAIAYGNKIFFAGGYKTRYDSLVLDCDEYGNNCDSVPAWVATDRIDIWDVSTNTWSVAHLSEARAGVTPAILGNKIVFAGGVKPYVDNNFYLRELYIPVVDFFNAADNSWSSGWYGPANTMMIEYYSIGLHIIGTKMLIQEGAYSDKIHIYDDMTNSWSIASMPYKYSADILDAGKIVQVGSKMLFFDQYSDQSNNGYTGIDIYNSITDTWCHTQLNFPLGRMGVVRGGNSVYIAGGLGAFAGCCNTPVDTVWRIDF